MCHEMSHAMGRTVVILLALIAGVAHAADPVPRSDAIIGPLAVAPAAPADVTRQCDTRLAALESQKAQLESLPLTTPAADLLSTYDDVYNLAVTTAYSETFLKDAHPDVAIRKAAEDCLQRAAKALTALSMSRAIYERLKTIDVAQLAPEMRFTVQRQLDAYRRAGVDREPAVRGGSPHCRTPSPRTASSSSATSRRTAGRSARVPRNWTGCPTTTARHARRARTDSYESRWPIRTYSP